jgi:hypothetical protein
MAAKAAYAVIDEAADRIAETEHEGSPPMTMRPKTKKTSAETMDSANASHTQAAMSRTSKTLCME